MVSYLRNMQPVNKSGGKEVYISPKWFRFYETFPYRKLSHIRNPIHVEWVHGVEDIWHMGTKAKGTPTEMYLKHFMNVFLPSRFRISYTKWFRRYEAMIPQLLQLRVRPKGFVITKALRRPQSARNARSARLALPIPAICFHYGTHGTAGQLGGSARRGSQRRSSPTAAMLLPASTDTAAVRLGLQTGVHQDHLHGLAVMAAVDVGHTWADFRGGGL